MPVETQRAIIEGEHPQHPSGIFEVRARVVVPDKASILRTDNRRLVLRGFWTEGKPYTPFGTTPFDMGPENELDLEVQPDPDDDPNTVYLVRPRTIILEDRKVFGTWTPSVNGYWEDNLYKNPQFNFEALWERAGTH